eukprot:scaffold1852_cov170-Amphora_coffeaeformis.AAC.2
MLASSIDKRLLCLGRLELYKAAAKVKDKNVKRPVQTEEKSLKERLRLSSWTLGSVLENGWTTAMPTGIISADALDRASRLVSLSTR